ncbi:MAG: hypothetical protein IT210_17000 [Armatimonadetes bacterium]|nr:hypothetical protein [Armatimonadota bacterium]
MLGPYLDQDLAAGRITLDEAREMIAHFWIKGCDWIGADAFGGSGDAQHYQNIVLSGIDREGNDITNEVTYLALDVVEELAISDFPIAVRINPDSPARLLRRIAEVQRCGGGVVAVYNENLIIESLVRFGYPLEEACQFANDGCWEIQIPGKTNFIYRPFDTLSLLQETLGVSGSGDSPDYESFDSLYAAFHQKLAERIEAIHGEADRHATGAHPATLISLLEEDCIGKGRGYYDRGARYNASSPHAGGLSDTANSLLAVRRLVHEQKKFLLRELVRILRADWEGQDDLRRATLSRAEFYGNDSPDADRMAKRVFDDFLALVGAVKERNGVLRPPGVSTFGREIAWRGGRGATADGHRAGQLLATNFSPSPGTDREGPTAVIRSHCAMDLLRLTSGTALELKMLPASVEGERGLETLTALMRSFVALGGIFLHIDVIDNRILREAQQHPERHRNLSVRVSGWSARFVTLNREWQEMIINRTQQADDGI